MRKPNYYTKQVDIQRNTFDLVPDTGQGSWNFICLFFQEKAEFSYCQRKHSKLLHQQNCSFQDFSRLKTLYNSRLN